ncbi:MAG: hypothetical protein ACREP9_10905 [Candidatus Dormibacteraceae bacterium]
MKKVIMLAVLAGLLGGCSWFQRGDRAANIGGPEVGPGRGTTGVSSGAEGGSGITGSDLAPP